VFHQSYTIALKRAFICCIVHRSTVQCIAPPGVQSRVNCVATPQFCPT